MDDSRYRCTLTTRDGASRRVGGRGVVIGRQQDCDIVVADPSVSRRHALVRVGVEGCELVPLGKLPVEHNGKPCDRPTPLANGDEIKVATLVLIAVIEEAPARSSASTFQLVLGGASYGVTHTPFVIGSGESDDLILDRWPPGALRLHVAQGELFVEPIDEHGVMNGQPLELGALEPIDVGDSVGYGALGTLEIARGGDRAHTTITTSIHALPSKITVEMLPRGGRVVFSLPTGDHAVYLADRRLDLIMALVKPPSEYAAGDFIPDDVLRPIVWPRNPNVIRSEINVHITRCRRDLLAAGLPGPRLLQRSPGGGATRLALAPKCEVLFL